MRIDVSVVCAAADSQVAHEIADRLGQTAQARVWLEEVSEPVNEPGTAACPPLVWSCSCRPSRCRTGSTATTGLTCLLIPVPPPVAKLLVTPCKYPALLERKEFFRWSDAAVLRQLHRWAIDLHGDQGRQPPATAWQGSTEELWKQLVDRPGTQRVYDNGQARHFAHEAADYFRDVIIIRGTGRSLPMVLGELAQSIGVKLRGTSVCRPADGSSCSPVRVRFLIDNRLPPALARFIEAELGSEGRHVADVGLRDGSRRGSLAVRLSENFVLVSKDEDFPHMAMKHSNAWLIWVRVGNCRRVFLLDLFRRLWPNVLDRLESGDRFIEIR